MLCAPLHHLHSSVHNKNGWVGTDMFSWLVLGSVECLDCWVISKGEHWQEASNQLHLKYLEEIFLFPLPYFAVKKHFFAAFSLPSLTLFNTLAKFSSDPHLTQPCWSQPHSSQHREQVIGRLCQTSPSLVAQNVGWQPTNEPAIRTKEKIRLHKVVLVECV